jgi:hypothetical protein
VVTLLLLPPLPLLLVLLHQTEWHLHNAGVRWTCCWPWAGGVTVLFLLPWWLLLLLLQGR